MSFSLFHSHISRSRQHAQAVDHKGADEGQLHVDGVDEAGCQGTGDAAQGLGGVEKAHHQIFLRRPRLAGDHALEHRHAHGIAGVDHHAEEDKQGDVEKTVTPRADREQTSTTAIRERRILVWLMIQMQMVILAAKEMKPTRAFTMPVVGGGQAQLVLQIVVEGLVKAGVAEVGEDVDGEQQCEGHRHELAAVDERLEGVGPPAPAARRRSPAGWWCWSGWQMKKNSTATVISSPAWARKERRNGDLPQESAHQVAEGPRPRS